MQRFVLPLLLLLSMISFGESYMVIFKTGKVLQGTLVSETEDAIVFKDSKGMQFSLKKRLLDLEKMNEANAASASPAPTTPAPSPDAPATPPTPSKKASKVYTTKDIEALREKYGETSAGAPSEGTAPPIVGTVTRENYHKYLQDAGAHMGAVITQLNSLLDGMATAWEVASSTGRDPSASVKDYLSGKAATEILSNVATEMSNLDSYQEALANPPKEFAPTLETFSTGLKRLQEAYGEIRSYDYKQNMTVFRNRIAGMFGEVRPVISTLQSAQSLVPEETPEKEPEATEPPTDEPQSQPEPETQPRF